MIAKVKYDYVNYNDIIDVYFEEGELYENIIEKAMEKLKIELKGELPNSWCVWKIINKSELNKYIK